MIFWKFNSWFFTIMIMLRLVASSAATHPTPNMQKTALFQFKQSLSIDDLYQIPPPPKTVNWNMSSDHCTWEGVTCEHKTGDVIGLDLSCSFLVGAIHSNSTLFQLIHLQSLNLFGNNFSLSNQFPEEFGFFAKGLTHLNLSNTGFSGFSGVSHLYKLVSLDLSSQDFYNQLEYGEFKLLLQNLTQLRVLNLNDVQINSVLPMNFSTSLRVLNLGSTGLYGVVPQEIFHLPNLEVLDLSVDTADLVLTLPKVKWGSSGSLQHLDLDGVKIYGGIPDSIGFLESLATLYLFHCNLFGPIPRSIGNLSRLGELDLSHNHLNGPIPKFEANHTNLIFLDLGQNNLTGPFPSWVAHPFELNWIGLSSNSLTGPLPSWFSQLVNLYHLNISSNNFSGVLDIQMFSRFNYLESLDLSHNSLSVRSTSMATLPPNLRYLGLSSCQMKEFPHIAGDAKTLESLDLSNNQIDGEIPHWAGSLFSLNLSHNRLTGGLEKLPWNNINYLDLQSNMLSGSLPSLICNSSSLEILNLSHNNLSGVLPICRTNLTSLSVFDVQMNNIQGNLPSTLSNFRNLVSLNLHGNKLQGRIPSSFDEFDNLEVLDLGSNQMNDTFPHFLEAIPNLQVLVLRLNKFHGLINKSSNIEHPFPSLRILDLSYNEFSGPLPTIYFKNFKAMMDGDVNKKKATYMTHTHDEGSYSDSTSLVIKGMEIELVRILTVFTTIDVSTNNFEGEIGEYIANLVSLIYLNLSHNHLTGHIPSSIGKLSMLESLDLSYNRLGGEIPPQLANISFLARLNLSQNQLSGQIPKGPQFNTFDNDSYVGNLGLCGYPLSKECERDTGIQEEEEDEDDDDYFFSGFTWKAVVIGYGCGVVPSFTIGYLMLLAGKPKWFAGIIARELGLKVRRMEIRMRYI